MFHVCAYKFRETYSSYFYCKRRKSVTMYLYAGIWIVIIPLPSDCFEVKKIVYFHDIDNNTGVSFPESVISPETADFSISNSIFFSENAGPIAELQVIFCSCQTLGPASKGVFPDLLFFRNFFNSSLSIQYD